MSDWMPVLPVTDRALLLTQQVEDPTVADMQQFLALLERSLEELNGNAFWAVTGLGELVRLSVGCSGQVRRAVLTRVVACLLEGVLLDQAA